MSTNSDPQSLQYFSVWDRSTRCFHWINVLCIIGLIAVGIVILNNKTLDVSAEGKILLKTVHVYIGYIFVLNLLWRFVWAFIGNKYARWKSILPMGKGYWGSLRAYISDSKAGHAPQYLGHNPVAKLMVALLFLLLSSQAVTGLILAGTDLYLPPFGSTIAQWVADSDIDQSTIANLKPGSKENIDARSYAQMRDFRKPIINMHVYVFYALLVAIALHIIAVIITEVRERNGLVSAMFTGKKVASKKPVD